MFSFFSLYLNSYLMKHLFLSILILLWLLITIIAALTFVGWIILVIDDTRGERYWFSFGRRLLDAFLG